MQQERAANKLIYCQGLKHCCNTYFDVLIVHRAQLGWKTRSRRYLSHGGGACFRDDGRGRGVNLHAESKEDATAVEDSFTQTLVQGLEKWRGLAQFSLDQFWWVCSNPADIFNIGSGFKRGLQDRVTTGGACQSENLRFDMWLSPLLLRVKWKHCHSVW